MSRMNRKERRTLFMQIGAVLIVICLVAALALPAFAEETSSDIEPYTYTVRIFPGDKGTIDGSEDPFVVENIEANSEWTRDDFDWMTQAAPKEAYEDRYYVTGMRESGKDNNTNVNYQSGEFVVDRDIDLVISYGIKGVDVPYTIHYLEAGTNTALHDPQTYYGNAGDQPAIAYLYIEGYIPQYKIITATIKEDSDNDWTFYYVKAEGNSENAASGNTDSVNTQNSGSAKTDSGAAAGTGTGTGTSTGGTSTGTGTGTGGTSTGTGTGTGGASTGTGTGTGGTSTGTGTGTGGTSTGTGTGTGGTSTGTGTGTGTAGTAAGTGAGGTSTGTGTTAAGAAAAGDSSTAAGTDEGTLVASNGTVNTRKNGPVEVVDLDETQVPLTEYTGEEDTETGAETNSELVNSETEGVVRASGMSGPVKVIIGMAVVVIAACAGWFFFRRYSADDD